jgi:benzaldehyde dehydrogenase (NAD)
MRAYEEEIFGPVACVTPFDDDEQAVQMANDTEYGLSVGVLSRDIQAALSMGNKLRTGLFQVNDQTIVSGGQIPFGGRGCSGNGSRIGGPANWEEFTQWQWVAINGQAPSYPF